MSDRRRSECHDRYSPEPVIIERSPRRPQARRPRTARSKSPRRKRLTLGSKLYNLFKSRKETVRIIQEVPVRSRRLGRQTRRPSPPRPPSPSPSPPRGPTHSMSSRGGDTIFAPLPPRLPVNPKHGHDNELIDFAVEERVPRHQKVKIVHDSLDENAFPKVEATSPPRKRDSGKYVHARGYGEDGSGAVKVRDEGSRTDARMQRLTDDFNNMLARERREKQDAQRVAVAAQDKIDMLEADLAREKRQRSLEQRERTLAEREKRLSQDRDIVNGVRRPRERQEVVVVNHPPVSAVGPVRDAGRFALERARDDYRRREHCEDNVVVRVNDERRPASSDQPRARRASVIIVDGNQNRNRGHARG